MLDENGTPNIVERALILPPQSALGAIDAAERQRVIQGSLIYGTYEKLIDRESASEILAARAQQVAQSGGALAVGAAGAAKSSSGVSSMISEMVLGSTGPRGGKHPGLVEKMAGSAVRSIGSGLGREIIRGILGGLFGGKRR